MSRPVNNMDIYYFYNMGDALAQSLLKGTACGFRYMKDLLSLSCGMFGYENLPDDLTSQILEMSIMVGTNLCFYKPLDKVYLCTYVVDGNLDFYNRPLNVEVKAFNGRTLATNVPFADIVLVRDNIFNIPPVLAYLEYIGKMESIEITLDKQIDLAKLPAVFKGEPETIKSFKNLFNKRYSFDPIAVTDKSMIDNTFEQFDINYPIQPESLMELYKNYRNFVMESMGIYGISSQKRERLLVGEVQSQNDYVDMIYQQRLNERKRFVEECNEKFGTNIELVEVWKQYRREEMELQGEQQEIITEASGGAPEKKVEEVNQ